MTTPQTPYENEVAAWAFRDAFPVGYDVHTGAVQDTVRVPLVAVNNWHGIDHVIFTLDFDGVAVADADVTQVGRDITVRRPRWADVFSYGKPADYWYFDLDLTGLPDHFDGNIVEVTVVSRDKEARSLIALGVLTPRRIVVNKAPVIRYVNTDLTTGLDDGSSPENAWRTVEAANSGVDVDIIYVTGISLFDTSPVAVTFQQKGRAKYLRWVGQGVVWRVPSGRVEVKDYQSFEGIDVDTYTDFRTAFANHVNHEWSSVVFQALTDGSGPWSNHASTHVSYIGTRILGGANGPSMGADKNRKTKDVIIHGLTLENSGTFLKGPLENSLVERCRVTGCAGEGRTPGQHFGGIHPFSKKVLKGMSWNAKTRTISGDLSNLSDYNETDEVRLLGISGNHRVLSRGDVITVEGSMHPEDLVDATVLYASSAYRNMVLRYNELTDNGSEAGGFTYYLMLIQGGGGGAAAYNNIVYDWMGLQQMVQFEGPGRNIQFVHNTVLATDAGPRGVNFASAYDHRAAMVRNNILEVLFGNPGEDAALDHNLLRNPRTGNVTDNIVADPALCQIDIAPYDFEPSPQSPAIGAGVITDVRFDIFGTPRGLKPTIGAVEVADEIVGDSLFDRLQTLVDEIRATYEHRIDEGDG